MRHAFLTIACLAMLAFCLKPAVTLAADQPSADIVTLDDEKIEGIVNLDFNRALEGDIYIDALESAADAFRSQQARTKNGEWKLTLFYRGILADIRNPAVEPTLERWRSRYPKSPTPHIIAAQAELKSITGEVFIESFSFQEAQSRALPQERLAILRNLLEDAPEIVRTDPHWYVLAGQAGLINSIDEAAFTALMLRGIERFPDYDPLYATATDYFLPKWGRKADALERWATLAVAHEPASSPNGAYALIYWHAFIVQYRRDLANSTQIDLERLRTAIKMRLAKDPSPSNRTSMTLLACAAGDLQQTKELFDSGPAGLSFYPWGSTVERAACYDWAHHTVWHSITEYARQLFKALRELADI